MVGVHNTEKYMKHILGYHNVTNIILNLLGLLECTTMIGHFMDASFSDFSVTGQVLLVTLLDISVKPNQNTGCFWELTKSISFMLEPESLELR